MLSPSAVRREDPRSLITAMLSNTTLHPPNWKVGVRGSYLTRKFRQFIWGEGILKSNEC